MNLSMKPIGTMRSLFHFKNGTPRQASVCTNSAPGILTIEKSVFNNPEHSLEGLDEYSHAWVIFVFHKNNNPFRKAKVKPPRLNGKRTGVFSSRSPYRPNNIGLSLVKIDKVEGPTIHFSGVDMIDGTPVLDVKPYIPDYDCPDFNPSLETTQKQPSEMHADNHDTPSTLPGFQIQDPDLNKDGTDQNNSSSTTVNGMVNLERSFYALSDALDKAGEMLTLKSSEQQNKIEKEPSNLHSKAEFSESDSNYNLVMGAEGEAEEQDDLDAFLGGIISQAVHSLAFELPVDNDSHPHVCESVVSTSTDESSKSIRNLNAELECSASAGDKNKTSSATNSKSISSGELTAKENADFKTSSVVAPWLLNPPVQKIRVTFTTEALQQLQQFSKSSTNPDFRLQLLSSPGETEAAIRDVLREEPRSVYRRQHCQDSLYFFTVDVVHVTCWFDGDTAQVVRLKPMALVTRLQEKKGENS